MHFAKMSNYPPGSRIQHKSGYIFLKTQKGMMAEHRFIAEQKILRRDLEEGERVFRRNGDREDNRPENLVVLKFSAIRFKLLEKSRVLYIPKFSKTEEVNRNVSNG